MKNQKQSAAKPKQTAAQPQQEIAISPEDFDISRVVIHDPTTFTGKADVATTTSKMYYLDENDVECIFYIIAPEQSCFGTQYIYPMGLAEEKQVPENATGMQIMYQCTSLETVQEPTPAEQAYIDCMKALHALAVEKGKEEVERETPLVPDVSINSFAGAARKNNYDLAVKPVFEHPKQKDGKKPDTTKPLRQYIKLVTEGQGKTLVVKTPFYGPGDKKMNPARFAPVSRDAKGVRGNITPCVRSDGLFWGAHGKNSHGCSLRFKVVEANFTPIVGGSSMPSRRMLGKNNAPAEEREEGEDEDFDAPGGDATNPARALEAAAKATAPKVGSKPAPKAKTILTKTAAKAKVAPVKVPAKASPKTVAAKPAPKAKAVVKPAPKAKAKVAEPEPEEVEEENVEDENEPLLGEDDVEEEE